MKRKIIAFVLTICMILPCAFLLTACDGNDNTTDCAYLQYVPANSGEVVQYTSYMYADSKAHMYVFESAEKRDNGEWEDNYILKISFNRGLGVDYELDEAETFVVAMEGWSSMEIRIKKEYYDSSKKVYLNGEDITAKADPALSTPPTEGSTALGTFWYDGVYYFEDFGLVKGNKSNYINTIEYK